jgi:hypothetical protein
MGCCETREHDYNYKPPSDPSLSYLRPVSDGQLSLQHRVSKMEGDLYYLPYEFVSPNTNYHLADHAKFKEIDSFPDTDIRMRFEFALELLSDSPKWVTEHKDEFIGIFSQESSKFDTVSTVIKEEIILGDYFPTQHILDSLYDPAKRMAWDKNITYMRNEGEDQNDVICYNRIEYFIIKKYLAERRVIFRHRNEVVVVYYSVDKEVPQEMTKGASLRKILMGVHFIHQEQDNTKLIVITQLETIPNLGKKIMIKGIVSWIKSFKKYLVKTSNT